MLTGFGRPPARKHPLGPGTEEEWGPTCGLGTKAQEPAPSRPSTLATLPCSHELTGPPGTRCPPARTHALGPGTGKSGGRPNTLATRHTPLANPQPHRVHGRFSQVPIVALPPRNCYSASWVHQTRGSALGMVGVLSLQDLKRQTPTSACARFRAGNGKNGGEPTMLTTPPRYRSRTPSCIAFIAASVRGPWLHYHLEIATAPAGFTRPGAQPSARRTARSWRDASSPPVFMSAGRWAHARGRSCVRAPGAGVTDGRSTLEDGRGGGMRPNQGFQSRL